MKNWEEGKEKREKGQTRKEGARKSKAGSKRSETERTKGKIIGAGQ